MKESGSHRKIDMGKIKVSVVSREDAVDMRDVVGKSCSRC